MQDILPSFFVFVFFKNYLLSTLLCAKHWLYAGYLEDANPLPRLSVCSVCCCRGAQTWGSVGRAREDGVGIGRLTISRIACARLTPSSSVYEEGGQRVTMEAGGASGRAEGGDCATEVRTPTPGMVADGRQRCVQLRPQLPLPLRLPWQSLCSMDSWFPAGSTSVLGQRWRWLSAVIHLAPSPHPGPQLPLLAVRTELSPQEIWGPLTYPPGPLISTQPLELCHPQYGS